VATNSRMQTPETRLGSGRANQLGSCPELPTNTNSTPRSFEQDLRSRTRSMIFDSSSAAGIAIRLTFERRLLGIASSRRRPSRLFGAKAFPGVKRNRSLYSVTPDERSSIRVRLRETRISAISALSAIPVAKTGNASSNVHR